MSDREVDTAAADREAADWHARLGVRPVSAATLAEFQIWRGRPEHLQAYQRVEAIWRRSGALVQDPEVLAMVKATLSKPRVRRKKAVSGPMMLGGGLAVALVAAVAGLFGLQAWSDRLTYATAVGEQRTIRLEDGSLVRLDTDTRVRIRFAVDRRTVLLDRGQALFQVERDVERPFSVAAGDARVTALGTRFDVRRDGPQGVRVTLVQGAVEVIDDRPGAPPPHRLSPGQQWSRQTAGSGPLAVDVALATSWSEGRLIFRNTPLRQAVAEVNRYLPDKIVLDAGAAAGVGVNGSFAVGDREAFVAAAADLFDLTVRENADGSVRLSGPSAG